MKEGSVKKNFFISLLTLISITGLIFLDKKGLLDKPKNVVYMLITPIQQISYKIGSNSSHALKDLFSFGELRRENKELESSNSKLLAENANLREAILENSFLKKQLGIPVPDEYSLKLAQVVSININNNYQSITVNRGTRDGVSEGEAVALSGNIFVGKIEKTYENRSDIALINNPKSSIPVFLQNKRAQGILKGEYGLGMVLDFVPIESEVNAGEKVITLGMENMPRGLLVGEIQEINSRAGDLFKKAVVRPFADLKHIEEVFIISKK